MFVFQYKCQKSQFISAKNLISQNFEIKMSHKCHTRDRSEGKIQFSSSVLIKLAKLHTKAKESSGRDFEERTLLILQESF